MNIIKIKNFFYIKNIDFSEDDKNNYTENLKNIKNHFEIMVKYGIKKIINDNYNNIKEYGISFYEKRKINFIVEYKNIKNEVTNIPEIEYTKYK